jgi:hypothetical protein
MIRRILAGVLVTLTLAQASLADVIVLGNQQRFHGTLANREEFARDPHAPGTLALLPPSTATDSLPALLRFERADISHVILEDGASSRVFDLTVRAPAPRATTAAPGSKISDVDTWRPTSVESSKARGTALVVLGLGVVVLGAAVKFGGAKASVTETSLRYEEHSYNAANYACMGIGAIMFVSGVVTLGSAPVTAAAPGEPGARLALTCRF